MQKRLHHLLIFILLAASLTLVGCGGRQPADEEASVFVVADLFATPGKALATVELSPTPSPTATIPSVPTASPAPTLPLPTVVVLQQPTLPIGTFGPTPTFEGGVTTTPSVAATQLACAAAPELPFTPIWQNISQAQFLMGCPVGGVESVAGVFQFFEHGFMFWRESDRSIFVLSELAIRGGQDSDSWWRLADTWADGETESDPGLQPPAGLIQPVRGFGKVWRSNAFIREAVGWARTEEIGGAALWQNFDGGWMMTGPDGVPIYVLTPLDQTNSSGTHLGALPR